jgi:hypothetical protein
MDGLFLCISDLLDSSAQGRQKELRNQERLPPQAKDGTATPNGVHIHGIFAGSGPVREILKWNSGHLNRASVGVRIGKQDVAQGTGTETYQSALGAPQGGERHHRAGVDPRFAIAKQIDLANERQRVRADTKRPGLVQRGTAQGLAFKAHPEAAFATTPEPPGERFLFKEPTAEFLRHFRLRDLLWRTPVKLQDGDPVQIRP